ncbi:RpiB/LacA/LacB family sugar-phosphate isomerase [Erysipelothrix urinaevulpis]|uniref:RpiB/LacA/LacB family sugar-phosphate isomerase n=1 Tax=Erysipelothrix urinaevulpis TaxID=2683717 RepID=UPI001359F312|nr:RpiB/LacA/LacB family sugar-phosphate isomerase [Erysipelothrix urinaevulpis]
MRIAIGCDHIVTDVKDRLRDQLINQGHDVIDCGTYDNVRTHYPIYGKRVGELVSQGVVDKGIVLCGTGVGITNAAQKVYGTRVALVRDVATAKDARETYNANIIGFGGRIAGFGLIEDIVETFLTTEFDASVDNVKKVEEIDRLIDQKTYKFYEDTFDKFLDDWEKGCYVD